MANNLLGWSKKQGHILSGGGTVERFFVEGRDYAGPQELPHYHLQRGSTWAAFLRWLEEGRRWEGMVGAWRRPLFMGGWQESTEADTTVYNLQTASIFIDMRFPTARPDLRHRRSLAECTLDELRALSRQHCFAGFSLPECTSSNAPVVVRHHSIDWNFHPDFPRSRPNKWRVQMSDDEESFKEFGFAVDEHGQSVYMERWARLPDGRGRFLAMRRVSPSAPDALLVVVGNHFAMAVGRERDPPQALPEPHADAAARVPTTPVSPPTFPSAGVGGCAALADAAFFANNRPHLEWLLSLRGLYGIVDDRQTFVDPLAAASQRHQPCRKPWEVVQATHPWLEGHKLFCPGDVRVTHATNGVRVDWLDVAHRRLERWLVLDTNMSVSELKRLFLDDSPSPTASKL